MAKVIISLPDRLLAKVDSFAEAEDYNRSELIRLALRLVMKKPEELLNVESTD